MKFAAIVAAVATFAATVKGDVCPASETVKLLQLAFEPSLPQCQEDSTFTFIPPQGAPTADQLQLMCASDACHSTIAALEALNPADCDMTFSNGVTLNVHQLLVDLKPTCANATRSLRH